mgnify:CR=1 FL=1
MWKNDEDWIQVRKGNLRRFFVYVLTALLVFVNIDYFTEGFVLSLVKQINYSLILKIFLAVVIILIAIIISVLALEIFYRNQFQDKIALELTSHKLMDKVKDRYHLYNEGTQHVMIFKKVSDKKFYKRRVVDSGPGILSPWGYRVVYDFEHREIQLHNYSKHIHIHIKIFKTSGVNGGAIFDVVEIVLTQEDNKLSEIKYITDFYKGKTMAHDSKGPIEDMLKWYTYHHKLIDYELQGKKYNALENTKGKHTIIVDRDTLAPYELRISGKTWKMLAIK